MVIPNKVMKFDNFEFVDNFGSVFDPSSAHACHVESIRTAISLRIRTKTIWIGDLLGLMATKLILIY